MIESEDRIAESSAENSAGNVRIASDVVATIASLAASDVPGVSNMSGGVASGIADLLGNKKNLTRGVKVEIKDQETTLDIFLIVEYGSNIADVAKQVQERVNNTVETMTGLTCRAVNIHVQGVNFPQGQPGQEKDE